MSAKAHASARAAKRRSAERGPGPAGAFSVDGYMADAKTRVFTYNGRKLVAILGREDFPGERNAKVPPKVIEFASRQPLTAALMPGRIGYHPKARGQKVLRPNGDWAFTLLFCIDGVGTLDVSDGKYRLTRGTLALLRPFEFHAYEADERQPWSYYWIHFTGTMAQQYYDLLTNGGARTCLELHADPRFIETFDKMLNIYEEGHAYKMLVQASAAMHQLLGDLYGVICSGRTAEETTESRIERTVTMMRNNIALRVSIHELAAVANMSHAYYALQFRRQTGHSPRTYFNQLKIAKACDYLHKTNTKVETIAHLVGYDDPFYFCRLFKRVTGQTPTTYRRTSRAAANRVAASDHSAAAADTAPA